jgi:C1A family cysteine protease
MAKAKKELTVAAIKTEIANNALGWVAEENPVTQLSADEQDLRLGYQPNESSGELSLEARESVAAASHAAFAAEEPAGAPAAVDLRNFNGHNYITPVKDQSSCGSCVAFGSVATVEGTMRFVGRNPGLAVDFSEGQLFHCIARAQGRNCDNGWWVAPALTALRDQGVVDEACCPYTPADAQCTLCTGWQSRVSRIRGFSELRTAAAMKDWLSTKGPLVACFTVYSDFFAYRSGVYRRSPSAVQRGGHCISVVGYSDALGAWICKNSWGTGWGSGGFFSIAYGQCGIDASMWGVETGAVPPTRTLAPLHRYWNGSAGDHFYTTNWGELGGGRSGWVYEGVQCDISPIPQPGLVPLYRYWNGRATDHFYTTSWSELGAGRYGWAYEGVQGYVSPTPHAGLVPLYRYWNPRIADHFYTTSWGELGNGRYGWGYEGIQCYVWPASATASDDDVPATFRTTTAANPDSAAPQSSPMPATDWGSDDAASPPATFVTASGSGELSPPNSFVTTSAPAAAAAKGAERGGCGCSKQGADEMQIAWRRKGD